MKKFLTFIFIIFVIFIFLTPFIISCNSKSSGETAEKIEEKSDAANENTAEDEAAAAKEAVKILPDLPEMDFNGYEFKVLIRIVDNPDWTEWRQRDIYAEEESGDPVNDAVYRRNRAVEEKYNFTVSEIPAINNFDTILPKAVKSGDDTYDIVCPGYKDSLAIHAQSGMFLDFFGIEYIDFSKPWWDQNAPEQLKICGKLYATFSDMLVLHKDATEAMIFNKQLVADLGLEIPYTLVREGNWTMDKLLEFAKAGKKDLDGDAAMTTDDQFGLVAQLDSITSWVHGCGMAFGGKDNDDYPTDNFPENQKLYSVIEKTFELMYDEGTIDLHHYENKFPIYDYQRNMFSENRGLVSWIRMRIVETLRSMETDFGILPLPKYDKEQSKYYSYINPYTANSISIPKSCSDPDRAGFILEALSAESRYTVQPAFYDTNLKGKYSRDNDSEEMLDIIFSNENTIFDVMEIYGFGNFVREYIDLFRKQSPSEYMSLYEKRQENIEKAILKCIGNFTSLSD